MTNDRRVRLRGLRPLLETPDLVRTLSFWTDTFGFDCVARMDDDRGRPLWSQLVRDDVRVMFTTHYHDDPEEGDEEHVASLTGALYIDVDDVDALAASYAGRVDVVYGPADQPHGMREIGVRDPNGYLVIFGQPTA